MTWRPRRLAAAGAGLAAAIALGAPAALAQAAVGQDPMAPAAIGGYTPGGSEWWLDAWNVRRRVWPLTEGAGVTVAVVDSGVQAGLPDLRGVVLSGGDTAGDGTNGQRDFDTETDGHGTAVAVMIAGQGDGPDGTVGVAPEAKILPVHVIYPVTSNDTAIANGITYAVEHGASVVNLSIGGLPPSPASCDPVEQGAVAYALAHNVVVVAGAGDTNLFGPGTEEPGTCAGVLTVGAVEPGGSLWRYSGQGPNVSVTAPGDHMTDVGRDGRYAAASAGTSFSAPLVSGAAALIRSRYPSMPWFQVVQRLIDTAIPEGSPVPNDSYGYGIIDIAKAVDASRFPVAAAAPNPVYARYLAWLRSPGGRSWAKASGVPAPGSASPALVTLIAVVVVAVVVVAAAILALVLLTRKRFDNSNKRGGRVRDAMGRVRDAIGRMRDAMGRSGK